MHLFRTASFKPSLRGSKLSFAFIYSRSDKTRSLWLTPESLSKEIRDPIPGRDPANFFVSRSIFLFFSTITTATLQEKKARTDLDCRLKKVNTGDYNPNRNRYWLYVNKTFPLFIMHWPDSGFREEQKRKHFFFLRRWLISSCDLFEWRTSSNYLIFSLGLAMCQWLIYLMRAFDWLNRTA